MRGPHCQPIAGPSTATSPPSYDRLAVARNLETELEGLTASPAV
jgi:hypothetical protein